MEGPEEISTGGGAFVHGNVESGTFIGRDQIVVISGYSRDQLDQILNRLVPLLRQSDAQLRFTHREGQGAVAVTGGDVSALMSLEAATDVSTLTPADQATYLAALLVNPLLRRWATRFVPLSGTLTIVEDPAGTLEVHPEFSILHTQGEGAARRVFREKVSDITTVVHRYSTFVILGDPGAGKTTVLCKLALEAAEKRLRSGEGPLPFMISLADYRNYADPYAFLIDQARQKLGDSVSLRELLGNGELLLLCDSLNETPRSDDREYRSKVRAWREFIHQWPGNQVVFSCRGRDYSEPLGVQQVEIDPLDEPRVHLFLEQYLGERSADTFWNRITRGPENLLGLARNPYLLTMLMTIYLYEGDLPTNRALLFTSFIEVLFRREEGKGHAGWLPQSVLFSALAQLAWTMLASGEGTRLSHSEIARFLREQLLREQLDVPPGSGFTPSDLVIQLGLATNLLESHLGTEGEEEIYFYHHLLQEAMAAREMLRRWKIGANLTAQFYVPRLASEMPDPGPLRPSEPLPPPPSNGWEETTILAAGLAQDPTAFISSVREVNPPLGARCLLESGIQGSDELRAQLQQDVRQEALNRQVHLRARISAGDVLGRLSDPRFERLHVEDKLLVIAPMVEVGVSRAHIGSPYWMRRMLSRKGLKYAEDEGPRHTVVLSPYQISSFPVTNENYSCFVQDDGYLRPHLWTESGRAWLNGADPGGGPEAEFLNLRRHLNADPSTLARWTQDPNASKELAGWRALVSESDERALTELRDYYSRRSRLQPAFWDDERYNHSNHPVVGVTWYEAMAYCSWLTGQLRLSGRLPDGYVIRLPSEVEWEYASTGHGQRIYPWGWMWNSSRANTREGQVLRPTPVGIYLNSGYAFNCNDMSGNVWEWTHSLHRPYPYSSDDGRESVDDQNYRALRGSSWIDPHTYARCSYRGRHPPDFFDYDQGFRFVIGRPLS